MIQFLTSNAVLTVVGLVTTLMVRYVPVIGKIPNWVTPWLNALLIFFGAFPAAAHAGLFGSVLPELGGLAKMMVTAGLVGMQHIIYESFIHHPLRELEAKGVLKKL